MRSRKNNKIDLILEMLEVKKLKKIDKPKS